MSDRPASRRASRLPIPTGASPVARVLLALAAVALVMALAGDAMACPTCKDGVAEADPEGVNIARGYFYSILIMLAMPATLIGSFSVYVWREMQRQKQALAKAAAEIVSPPALPITPPHP